MYTRQHRWCQSRAALGVEVGGLFLLVLRVANVGMVLGVCSRNRPHGEMEAPRKERTRSTRRWISFLGPFSMRFF